MQCIFSHDKSHLIIFSERCVDKETYDSFDHGTVCDLGQYLFEINEGSAQRVCYITNFANFYSGPVTEYACEYYGPGSYGSSKRYCSKCPSGEYRDENGATSCKTCSKGTYAGGEGNSWCTVCPRGYYQDKTGQESCHKYSAGEYQDMQGKWSCKTCGVGTYSDTSGSATCTQCPYGKYQPGTGSTGCLDCAEGTHQHSEGQTGCIDCDVGTYTDALLVLMENISLKERLQVVKIAPLENIRTHWDKLAALTVA